jgi:D-erythro-7,8-dihydroneopterin triphosphate epimerase
MDRIIISDLGLRCIIGINPEERREKQDVVINLSIYADLSKAGKSDKFEDTIDYRAIKKRIVSLVETSQFFLVEALAEAISKICLENPAVEQVVVRVDKPGALRFARTVGVEITRKQKNSSKKK